MASTGFEGLSHEKQPQRERSRASRISDTKDGEADEAALESPTATGFSKPATIGTALFVQIGGRSPDAWRELILTSISGQVLIQVVDSPLSPKRERSKSEVIIE
ncbi:MAG: hypothetical protein Q9219_003389 [cf. Caloplaca sp. 3 TL-2023]